MAVFGVYICCLVAKVSTHYSKPNTMTKWCFQIQVLFLTFDNYFTCMYIYHWLFDIYSCGFGGSWLICLSSNKCHLMVWHWIAGWWVTMNMIVIRWLPFFFLATWTCLHVKNYGHFSMLGWNHHHWCDDVCLDMIEDCMLDDLFVLAIVVSLVANYYLPNLTVVLLTI